MFVPPRAARIRRALALVFATVSLAATRASAASPTKNVVRAVEVAGSGTTRTITIRTSAAPTFTVFRLSSPMRIVVDISGGDVAKLEPLALDDGLVTGVSSRQFSADALGIGRVIVGFDGDVTYDVHASGNDVVVRAQTAGTAMPDRAVPPPTPPNDPAAKARLDATKREVEATAAKAAEDRKQAEQAAALAERQGSEAQRLARDAERLAAEARAAKDDALRLREQARAAAQQDRAAAEAAARDAESKLKSVQERERAVAATRSAAERLAAEAERTRRDAEENAARAEATYRQQRAELAELQARAVSEQRAAETAKKQAEQAQVEAAKAKSAAEAARLAAERTRTETAAKLAAIEAREQQANRALSEAAGEKRLLESERQKIAEMKRALEQQRLELDKSRAEAKADAERATRAASLAEQQARAEAAAARREAETARLAAEEAQRRAKAEAEQAKKLAELAQREAKSETEQAKKLAAQAKKDAEAQAAVAERARKDAEAQIAAADRAKREAEMRVAAAERAQAQALARESTNVAAAMPVAELVGTRAEPVEVARTASLETAVSTMSRPAPQGAGAKLKGVERRGSGARAALLLTLDGSPEYDVQRVDDPPRLVIELKDTRRATRRTTFGVDVASIQRVRLGDHESSTRAVLDLSRADVEPELTMTSEGLLVAMRSTSKTKTTEPAAANGLAVRDVQFKQDGDTARVVVDVPEGVTARVDDRSKRAWVLELHGAMVTASLERSLDASAYGSVVRMVSTYQAAKDPAVVNVVVNLDGAAKGRTFREGGKLVWEIQGEPRPVAVASSRTTQAAAFATEAQVLAQSTPTQSKVQRVSFDFKDADIVNVIRLIADITGENIITSEEVKGKVTVKLKNVPWDRALDTILKSKGYDRVRQNNITRIGTAKAIQEEKEQELARKKASEQVEETVIRMVSINYATASEILPQLKTLLSGRGSVQVDERTNTLIVEDLRSNIDKLLELTRRLDKQTPQVLIESRIVEASSNYEHELGIQWGGTGQMTAASGNPTGLVFPGDVRLSGAADDTRGNRTEGVSNPGRYAVNLPAPIGAGAGGGLGFVFGSAGGSQILQLRLSALEKSGNGRIISSPRVTTLDNRTAKISQGVDIPIQVTSAAGANTRFVPANLELEVTPHVTNDASVVMKIKTAKNEPNFSRTGANGDPTIEKKTAETEVLVRDGDTTVIGGIYTRKTAHNVAEVPFFSKIPVLGFFFRNTQETDERAELLIFITPRIVNRDEALSTSNDELPGREADSN